MGMDADVGPLSIAEKAALTLHTVIGELRWAGLRTFDWGIRCEHPEGFPTLALRHLFIDRRINRRHKNAFVVGGEVLKPLVGVARMPPGKHQQVGHHRDRHEGWIAIGTKANDSTLHGLLIGSDQWVATGFVGAPDVRRCLADIHVASALGA